MTGPVRTALALAAALAVTLALAGCAAPLPHGEGTARTLASGRDLAVDERILALDPDRIGAADVRDTLARGPAPRILLLHGGIYPVHLAMESFGEFLVAMGYPEARIRSPADGAWSANPYGTAERLAGIVAWHYEHDGMMPMLIGHSQGGIQAVKVLRVLAGEYVPEVPVWNPRTDQAEARTTIVDPFTGGTRPVVGLRVGLVSVVAAGGAAFFLPNQWTMIGALRDLPDTVEEFSGYSIALDTWAWTLPGTSSEFRGAGATRVRNVTLPAHYLHVSVPVTRSLPDDPPTREWIETYRPGPDASEPPSSAGTNAVWAAEVWHEVKRWWVIEAQRLIRAQRAGSAKPATTGRLE